MNNAAGNDGGEEVDDEKDDDDSGIGVDDATPEEGVRGDEGQPGAADDRVTAAVARVAPAVARPRGRGPGRSCTLSAGVAGVVGPPPARGTPPAHAPPAGATLQPP